MSSDLLDLANQYAMKEEELRREIEELNARNKEYEARFAKREAQMKEIKDLKAEIKEMEEKAAVMLAEINSTGDAGECKGIFTLAQLMAEHPPDEPKSNRGEGGEVE